MKCAYSAFFHTGIYVRVSPWPEEMFTQRQSLIKRTQKTDRKGVFMTTSSKSQKSIKIFTPRALVSFTKVANKVSTVVQAHNQRICKAETGGFLQTEDLTLPPPQRLNHYPPQKNLSSLRKKQYVFIIRCKYLATR